MIVLGIDPGPETCGVVLYDAVAREVQWAWGKLPTEGAILLVGNVSQDRVVVCERVQSYGIAGASLIETAEVYGRLQQAALGRGLRWVGIYRKEVLLALDITTRGRKRGDKRRSNDPRVRRAMIEAHGGPGCERKGGPLAMVSGHAWQALAAAFVAAQREA